MGATIFLTPALRPTSKPPTLLSLEVSFLHYLGTDSPLRVAIAQGMTSSYYAPKERLKWLRALVVIGRGVPPIGSQPKLGGQYRISNVICTAAFGRSLFLLNESWAASPRSVDTACQCRTVASSTGRCLRRGVFQALDFRVY